MHSGLESDQVPRVRIRIHQRCDLSVASRFAGQQSLVFAAIKDAAFLQQTLQPRVLARRCIERFKKRNPVLRAECEVAPVGQTLFGAGQRAVEDEFTNRFVLGCRCGLQSALGSRRQPQVQLFAPARAHVELTAMVGSSFSLYHILPDNVMTFRGLSSAPSSPASSRTGPLPIECWG